MYITTPEPRLTGRALLAARYANAAQRSHDYQLTPSQEAEARAWAEGADESVVRDRTDWLNTFDPDGFDGEPGPIAAAEATRDRLEAKYGWKRVYA